MVMTHMVLSSPLVVFKLYFNYVLIPPILSACLLGHIYNVATKMKLNLNMNIKMHSYNIRLMQTNFRTAKCSPLP